MREMHIKPQYIRGSARLCLAASFVEKALVAKAVYEANNDALPDFLETTFSTGTCARLLGKRCRDGVLWWAVSRSGAILTF